MLPVCGHLGRLSASCKETTLSQGKQDHGLDGREPSLEQYFSKRGPWTSSSIWENVRNANYSFPPKLLWWAPQAVCYQLKPPDDTDAAELLKFENHCSEENNLMRWVEHHRSPFKVTLYFLCCGLSDPIVTMSSSRVMVSFSFLPAHRWLRNPGHNFQVQVSVIDTF